MPTNLNSEKYERYFKGMFVAPTGRGKTIAAASWPGKTLIIDSDSRHRPIIDWYPERVAAGDFAVEETNSDNFWSSLVPLLKSLAQFNPYQNIIVDGVTSMTLLTITMQLKAKGGFDFFKKDAQKSDDTKGSKFVPGGIMVPSWDEFNGQAQVISHLIEVIKSFKCNVIFTAHPVTRTLIGKNKQAERYTSITAFGIKMDSMIQNYFDDCWWFDYEIATDSQGREIIKRLCYTQPSEAYQEAKTSFKGIPAVIDYTDKNLYDLVKEYL